MRQGLKGVARKTREAANCCNLEKDENLGAIITPAGGVTSQP